MAKSILLPFLGVLQVAWMAAGQTCGATPDGPPAPAAHIKGTIAVAGASNDRPTAAKLSAEDGTTYQLIMDAAGEDLARVMFGQKVDIMGSVSERDGQKWVQVVGFGEEKLSAAHELWRRFRCNACAVQKGTLYAAEPKDLHGAVPVVGRLYPYRQQFRAVTRDASFLWVATDDLIHQIEPASGRLVKTYDRSAGLPDQPVQEIASDGKTLWIVSRGSAAALPIGQDKVTALADIHFKFAKVLADGSGAWIIADSGAYRYASPAQPPQVWGPPPTGKRMAAEIDKGMWLPFWKQNTAFYMTQPVAIGQRLYVGSFGDIYELADGAWTKAIPGGSVQQAGHGRLWALTSGGVVAYEPQTKAVMTHKPDEIAEGRFTGLVVTDSDVWVTAEPLGAPKGGETPGGGVGRMDLATGKWQCWKKIDGLDAAHAVVQAGQDGAVWLIAHQGKYQTLGAHPGMTYVEKVLFAADGFGLHRWDAKASSWHTMPLAYENFQKRYICGQDGQGGDAEIGPRELQSLCVAADRAFAVAKLEPVGSFSGYWPCVEQVATKADDKWTAKFEHHPEQLDLQGQQPLVLNISNKGEMILPAVGHDDVLDLCLIDGRAWAITDGCVGWFDSAKGAWRKVVEAGYNFYWRPTAILDEGNVAFVGSDRGLVSRLDFASGRFEVVGGLKDRSVAKLLRQDGRLLAVGAGEPLGQLPAYLPGAPRFVDADAATWDGKTWAPVAAPAPGVPATAASASWVFKPFGPIPKTPAPFIREQVIGNLLWGPTGDGGLAPRYYVKEVYAPRLLDFGQDGKRMWFSTFSGLLRVDVPGVQTGVEKAK